MADELTGITQHDLTELRRWYEEYLVADMVWNPQSAAVIKTLDQDHINSEQIEHQVLHYASRLPDFEIFCMDCKEALDDWPEKGADGCIRTSNTIVLEAATRKGCRFCNFVLHILIDGGMLQTFRRIEARLNLLGECEKFNILLYADGCANIRLPARGTATTSGLWNGSFGVIYLDSTSDMHEPSINIFETAARWLHECDQCHKACGSPTTDKMPTRLLHYTKEGLRVVCTAGWTTKPRYATLSHCWGNAPFLKLLKENFNAFAQSIGFEQLPQTFKDALKITRKLGLDYLWIDSLCILQDSEQDWQIEAGQMSSVYGGSYVNIAASSAKGAHEGCLSRFEDKIYGFQARVTAAGHPSAAAQFERHDVYRSVVIDSHLATRAWAFQEKILPRRTMHFGHGGTLWECASKVATADLPDGLFVNWDATIANFDFDKSGDIAAWWTWWSNAVGLYSAAKATYPRDKLLAFSGIAKRIQKSSGEDYLAGIWRNASFEQQLCWHIQQNYRYMQLPPKALSRPIYRAPSWSWASVDYPASINVLVNERELYAHVIDAWTKPANEGDPFGEIKGGAIRVECSILLKGHFTEHELMEFELEQHNATWVTEAGYKFGVYKDTSQEFDRTDTDSCFLLPLVRGSFLYPARGIIIRRTHRVRGEFQRVGSFSHYDRGKLDASDHERDCQGRVTARAECGEVIESTEHPNEKFVITIV